MESKTQKREFNMKNTLREQMKTAPLKIVILSFNGGAICVFPFLVLQMRSMGITINEIAVLFLIIPVASLIGPIMSGLVADKLGRYNLVFIGNIILAAFFYNFLLLVPPVEQRTVSITCHQDFMNVAFDNCNNCINNLSSRELSGQLIVNNCAPCSNKSNKEIECPEQLDATSVCPDFYSTNKKIIVNFTTTYTKESSLCDFNVTEVSYSNMSYRELEARSCTRRDCDFKCHLLKGFQDCNQSSPTVSKTFVLVALIMFLGNFFMSASFTMLDASTLQFVKEYGVSLGKQKIMTVLGFGITPLIAGALIDMHSKKIGTLSFFPAFMLADALMFIAAVTTYFVSIKVEDNKSNIVKDLGKLVIRPEVDLFLLIALILGCNFGFIESYLFIYLQSLNAPNFLLGLTMTVGCLSSVPMLFFADSFEKLIGRHFVFLICFTVYAVRMFGYSFIKDPWMCLIFEALEAITYQLMWVTCLKLCPILAPKGLLATMTGMTGAIHYSFGKGIGGFIGGHVISLVGMRNAFRVFGGIALFGGIFYIVLHYAYLKKKIEERERQTEEEAQAEVRGEKVAMLTNGTTRQFFCDGAKTEQESFLAFAGSRNRLSLDGLIYNRNFNEANDPKRGSKEGELFSQKEKDTFMKQALNTNSMPHLLVADAHDTSGRVDVNVLKNSAGQLEP